MKITKFDKPTAKQLGQDLEKLIQAWAAERGLKAEYRGGQLDGITFTAKIGLSISDPKLVEDAARTEFDRNCFILGLKPEHFGKTIMTSGGEIKLVGLAMGRTKYPLRFQERDGTVRLYTLDIVPKILAAA